MSKKILASLLVAGGINVVFLIFHITMMRSAGTAAGGAAIACPNHCPALNLGAILIIALMAYLSLFRRRELMEVSLGKPLLLAFAVFYIMRIAAEFIIYGFDGLGSLVIIGLCAIPALIYLLPLVFTSQVRKYDPAR